MTQPTFSPEVARTTNTEYVEPKPPFERGELFALGAAAGAIVAAAISQYLDKSKSNSALDVAQTNGSTTLDAVKEVAKSGTKTAQSTLNRVADQAEAAFGSAGDAKNTAKRSGGILGGLFRSSNASQSTAASLADVAKDRAASALKQAGKDPYAVSGSVTETLREQLGSGGNDATKQQRGLGNTLRGLFGSASETTKQATSDTSAASSSVTDSI